jgi:hypothetical protein
MIFYGGYDPPGKMLNTMEEAGFLAFLYPAPDAENLKSRIGTVDFIPQGKP